jgi:hypothetical protein
LPHEKIIAVNVAIEVKVPWHCSDVGNEDCFIDRWVIENCDERQLAGGWPGTGGLLLRATGVHAFALHVAAKQHPYKAATTAIRVR